MVSLRLGEDTSSLARPVVVPRAPLLARLLQTTSHTLVMPNSASGLDDLPTTLRCSVCLQHASRPNFAGWLRKSVGQGSAHKQRAFCSAGANIVVTGHCSMRAGRADFDPSHLIMTRGGIWWWASAALSRLTRPGASPPRPSKRDAQGAQLMQEHMH